MLRTLITAALITAAATQVLHADPYTAFGYTLVISITLWFLWPLLRRVLRRAARRRSRRPAPSHTPAAPHLTQVNHHYHFYGQAQGAPAMAARPDYSRPALPLRTEGQRAHDAIYDIIEIDDDTTR